MRKTIAALATVLIVTLAMQSSVIAQDAGTPTAVAGPVVLVLVEHAALITNVDGGDPGPSAGDMIIWGPNALFDETNSSDTGATTQGVCTSLDETGQCLLIETIIFADGSTIQMQGLQAAGSGDSFRTIVGGSGIYLGAAGTVGVEPTDDLTTWIKTFEIWL
ncbi:MAG: hypothetical protein IT335_12000 [Thermomicrobiales bacterium]|nr:hypothetical protein [Thermomicrobiales bacterium]